ncbi:tyrosine-type recombinase/integrase [Diplocloster hominis]|uniref:tyrosine-type recombinase/integrase n=1 Tax=Diplocloster hominis TaxID=3079010 RepID=UPI0031B9E037
MNEKEQIIRQILTAMSIVLENQDLRKLEQVLIITLQGVKIEKECTELSTVSMSRNEYIIHEFETDKKLENVREKSIRQYVNETRRMLDYVQKDFDQVEKSDIKAYFYMLKDKVSVTTQSNKRLYISSFYNWAIENKYASFNPVACLKNIKPEARKKIYLSEEEKENIRSACRNELERALLEFLLSTGVRVGELINLDILDVDFNHNTVQVCGEKWRKYRTVFLTPKARVHLINYLKIRKDNNPALFVRNYDDPSKCGRMRRENAEKITKNLGVRAGIQKNCTVHIFRKTLATTLHRNGCSLEYIKEILGHASTQVTEACYITIEPEEIQYMFNRCVA